MTKQDILVAQINEMITVLSKPLPQNEVDCGWRAESQKAMLDFFQILKAKILKDEPIYDLNISRGMDHWGIEGGELLEKAAAISNRMRELT